LNWTFERKIETAVLIAYAATLVLVLGWATRRAFLGYFGIDHSGLDESSEEITLNYIGYGISVILYSAFWQVMAAILSVLLLVLYTHKLINALMPFRVAIWRQQVLDWLGRWWSNFLYVAPPLAIAAIVIWAPRQSPEM
jgi:hypothetical protein